MPISYIDGDATYPQGNDPKILAHVCNDRGGFGKGFALAVGNRWPGVKRYFKAWYSSKIRFELGVIQLVEVNPAFWVANMLAQHGYQSDSNPTPLRMEALRTCLEKLRFEALDRGASVHMPRIGSGLAGGDWDDIEPLIERELEGIDVFVYTLV